MPETGLSGLEGGAGFKPPSLPLSGKVANDSGGAAVGPAVAGRRRKRSAFVKTTADNPRVGIPSSSRLPPGRQLSRKRSDIRRCCVFL